MKMSLNNLLKETNQEREAAYDKLITAKQNLDAAQKVFNDASWEMQMIVSKIGIMIDQLDEAKAEVQR
jgi:uncharacterized protein (DUF3084 family)